MCTCFPPETGTKSYFGLHNLWDSNSFQWNHEESGALWKYIPPIWIFLLILFSYYVELKSFDKINNIPIILRM